MSLGETLRLAREEKGQTIAQVADATRMMTQIVEDLERDDYRRIAAPIYGRGFIKLYAEHLGLAPEPLIRDFMDIYTGSRLPQVVRRSAGVSGGESAGPSGSRAVPPSDSPTAPQITPVASGDPDLFSLAACRTEAVRSVADPAQPGETAPPRVRPVSSTAEAHAIVEPAPWREPAKIRNGGLGEGCGGAGNEKPLPWTPAVIGLVATVIILLLLGVMAWIHHQKAKHHRQPAPLKVERVLKPREPYFE